MKIKKIISILLPIILIFLSGFISIYFGTSYFSKNVEPSYIKLYFGGPNEEKYPTTYTIQGETPQQSFASNQKYYLNEININVFSPFQDSSAEFNFKINNYTKTNEFWELSSDESRYEFNYQKSKEYQMNNLPDFIFAWDFIFNGYLPIWIEPFLSQPSISVQTYNFLQKINYYTYGNSFYIDTKFEGAHYGEDYYLPTNLDKININLILDKKYEIVSPKEYSIQKNDDKTNKISFSIVPDRITYIEIIDSDKKGNSEIFALIFGIIFASLIGHYLIIFIDKFKQTIKKQEDVK